VWRLATLDEKSGRLIMKSSVKDFTGRLIRSPSSIPEGVSRQNGWWL